MESNRVFNDHINNGLGFIAYNMFIIKMMAIHVDINVIVYGFDRSVSFYFCCMNVFFYRFYCRLSQKVEQHSSSESLSTSPSRGRASPLSAQARREMDRKHLNDVTAARSAPLHHDPAQLLSLEESSALLREQSRKHQVRVFMSMHGYTCIQ